MSEECDHNAIHCECGHQQDIEEAVIAERNRIADALEREAARREILRETYFARTFAEFAERLRKGEV